MQTKSGSLCLACGPHVFRWEDLAIGVYTSIAQCKGVHLGARQAWVEIQASLLKIVSVIL